MNKFVDYDLNFNNKDKKSDLFFINNLRFKADNLLNADGINYYFSNEYIPYKSFIDTQDFILSADVFKVFLTEQYLKSSINVNSIDILEKKGYILNIKVECKDYI